jgi:hypothetical protein
MACCTSGASMLMNGLLAHIQSAIKNMTYNNTCTPSQVGNMTAPNPQPAAGRLLLLSTGATMFQTYDQAARAMVLGVNAATLTASLQQHLPAGVDIDNWPIQARSGAELSFDTVFQVRARIHIHIHIHQTLGSLFNHARLCTLHHSSHQHCCRSETRSCPALATTQALCWPLARTPWMSLPSASACCSMHASGSRAGAWQWQEP